MLDCMAIHFVSLRTGVWLGQAVAAYRTQPCWWFKSNAWYPTGDVSKRAGFGHPPTVTQWQECADIVEKLSN
jgi:hypothetical protein